MNCSIFSKSKENSYTNQLFILKRPHIYKRNYTEKSVINDVLNLLVDSEKAMTKSYLRMIGYNDIQDYLDYRIWEEDRFIYKNDSSIIPKFKQALSDFNNYMHIQHELIGRSIREFRIKNIENWLIPKIKSIEMSYLQFELGSSSSINKPQLLKNKIKFYKYLVNYQSLKHYESCLEFCYKEMESISSTTQFKNINRFLVKSSPYDFIKLSSSLKEEDFIEDSRIFRMVVQEGFDELIMWKSSDKDLLFLIKILQLNSILETQGNQINLTISSCFKNRKGLFKPEHLANTRSRNGIGTLSLNNIDTFLLQNVKSKNQKFKNLYDILNKSRY